MAIKKTTNKREFTFISLYLCLKLIDAELVSFTIVGYKQGVHLK